MVRLQASSPMMVIDEIVRIGAWGSGEPDGDNATGVLPKTGTHNVEEGSDGAERVLMFTTPANLDPTTASDRRGRSPTRYT